jgi:hypothetical protein
MLVTWFVIIIYSIIKLSVLLTTTTDRFKYITWGGLMYFVSSSLIFATANFTTLIEGEAKKYLWILNSTLYLVFLILILVEWKKTFYLRKRA